MGQLTTPCQTAPPSGYPFVCTIPFQTNNSWYGGMQYYPDVNVAQSNQVLMGITPNFDQEGIDLSQDDQTSGVTRRAKGVSRPPYSYIPIPQPTPPPCKHIAGCSGCLADAPAAPLQHNLLVGQVTRCLARTRLPFARVPWSIERSQIVVS
jgi:hypothetical protein